MCGEKQAIRQHLRARRRALSAAEVHAAGAAVRAHLLEFLPYQTASTLIGYIAAENEIPTADLLQPVVRDDREVYLPDADGKGTLMRWYPGEGLIAGRTEILQPANRVPVLPNAAGVALVPVVAWDANGTRLGRGGGFYDRLFALLNPQTIRIGLAYEFQQVEEIPRDPWDVPLHYVVTERRLIECGSYESVAGDTLQKGGFASS